MGVYSAETGVYPAINKVMHEHDESKVCSEIGVVEVCSVETGVYPAVNKVMSDHDEPQFVFRPYVRLLPDTVSNPVHPIPHWPGACGRWIKLHVEMVTQLEWPSIDIFFVLF